MRAWDFRQLAGRRSMCCSGLDREGSPSGSPNKRKPFINEQIKGGFETMNKNLKKVISAASALAVSASGIAAFAASYPDVPNTAEYYQAVSELSALGVIAGFDDGTFKPDENVTRAQITKMVVTALGSQVASAAEAAAGKDTKFADVPGSHWAAGFISVGTSSAAQNFINGYGPTAFGPEDNVTYAQAIKMLVAALGYSSSAEGAGGWPSGYLKYGYNLGLTNGLSGIGNDQQLNRAQVAVLIDNALKCPICVSTGQVQYNQFGQQIPVTLPKDGTGDLDGTKDGYQNLLNYAHDAYLVYGRVIGTFKSGAGVDADEVRFNVEKADNWDGYPINAAKDDTPDNVPVYKGQVTDADDYLFTYSEAIIKKDINDEYTLVSLTSYGASEKIELNSGDYKQIKAGTNSNNDYQLQMYKDSGRSKYDTYKIISDVGIYINGREMVGDVSELFEGDYIKGNKVGTITLIDSTEEGKSSTDGKYDYVMVSYYVDGVVDEVDVDTDEIVIAMDNECDDRIDRGEIILDLEDEDKDYHVILDGAEIDPSEIKEGDVVSVAYDVEGGFKNSDTYDIIVSRNQVEGRVSSVYPDPDDILDYEYTLDDGTVYKAAYDKLGKIESGVSYTLYLDAFGKIAKVEELASTKKYALLENVYMTNGDADAYVDVVTSDGYKRSYQIKTEDYNDFKEILMLEDKLAEFDTSAKLANRKQPEDRVIEYTTTTKDELRLKSVAEPFEFNGEFKSSTGKIDGRQLSESLSAIIDASDYKMEKSQSYSKVAYGDLQSGTTYRGYAFGQIGSDKVYQYVLIKDGIGGWNVANPWAIYVQSTNVNIDGSDNDAIVAYVNGELTTLPTDGSIATMTAGDVFFYKKNSDDEVEEIKVVAKGLLNDSYRAFYDEAIKNNFDFVDADTAKAFAAEETSEDVSYIFSKNDNVDDCELISGAIVDVSAGDVKFATSKELAKDKQSIDNFSIDNAKDYSLASDAKVCVYDYSISKAKDRVYASRSTSSVKKSTFDRASYVGAKNDNVVDFITEQQEIAGVSNRNYGNVNFAIAKVVDREITEILVILPDDDDGE